MTEYRIVSYDQDSEDKLMRAVHADDLCAAVWDLQRELQEAYSRSDEGAEIVAAKRWMQRLQILLEDTGAQAAMDHYR